MTMVLPFTTSTVSYACSHSQLNTETAASTCNLQIDKLLLAIKYTRAAWLIHQLLKAAFSHACAQLPTHRCHNLLSTRSALAKLNCNLIYSNFLFYMTEKVEKKSCLRYADLPTDPQVHVPPVGYCTLIH